MKLELVYILQGYEMQDPLGNLQDSVTVEIYANSEKEAIKIASGLVLKKCWRVSRIVQYKDADKK